MEVCSKTWTKFLSVGGSGTNTGGYARLSISFLSDSESIQRNTRIAGETMTTTDSQKPARRTARRNRARDGVRSTAMRSAAIALLTIWPTAHADARAAAIAPARG